MKIRGRGSLCIERCVFCPALKGNMKVQGESKKRENASKRGENVLSIFAVKGEGELSKIRIKKGLATARSNAKSDTGRPTPN